MGVDFEGFRKIYDEIMTVKEVSCTEREILGLTETLTSTTSSTTTLYSNTVVHCTESQIVGLII